MKKNVLFLFSIYFSLNAFAQNNQSMPKDTSEMSIEELMKMKSTYQSTEMEKSVNEAVSAASKKALPLRKSPSIISVVTAEEIEKSGARELMDVLRLVPGIEFNVDVQGVIGISVRGIWANEGKVLMMLDGQEINEIAYGCLMFGNNYNISQIKKIELIRGPGSAIYGGFAEYAVINIITKNGADLKGVQMSGIAGQMNNTYARQNASISVGNRHGDLTYSVSGLMGRGQRSNQDYIDIAGNKNSMLHNTPLSPTNLNAALSYKGLSARFIYDQLNTKTVDGLGTTLVYAYPVNFTNTFGEIKYSKKIGKNFEFQPRFNFKRTNPWESDVVIANVDTSNYYRYKIIADRYRLNLIGLWDISQAMNLTFGVEGYYDDAKRVGGVFRNSGKVNASYYNYAPFAQLLLKHRIANVTIGARYDYNNAFGGAFNPRLGITKKIGDINFKLLYASSYRAPTIENIQSSLGNSIKPELTATFEFETGYQINKQMFLTANIYDVSTKNSIRYYVNQNATSSDNFDGYTNTGKSGTQGLELDYKYKDKFGFINFSYGYYTVARKTVDASNAVPGQSDATLGIANHKFTLLTNFNFGKYFYLSPSVNFIGKRTGISYADANTLVYKTYDPLTLVNVYVGCTNLIKGLNFGLGVYNLLDQNNFYLQAYNSLHAPYPGIKREIALKVSYNLNFKKGDK